MLCFEFERRSRRWTQTQLGAVTRIPQVFISMIERGKRLPTDEEHAALARALDLAPELVMKPVVLNHVQRDDTPVTTAAVAQ